MTYPPGGPRRNIAIPFGVVKLEWSGYPEVKNFHDMFSHFDIIPVYTIIRTDRHLTTA